LDRNRVSMLAASTHPQGKTCIVKWARLYSELVTETGFPNEFAR